MASQKKIITAFLCILLFTGCQQPADASMETASAVSSTPDAAASAAPSAVPLAQKHADWITYAFDEEGNRLSTSIEGIEYMSQLDPRWSSEVLGDGEDIGHAGCLEKGSRLLESQLP